MPEIIVLDVAEYEAEGNTRSTQFMVLNEAGAPDPEEKLLVGIQDMASCLRELLHEKDILSANTSVSIFANFGGVIYCVSDAKSARASPQFIELLHTMINAPREQAMVAHFKVKEGSRAVYFDSSARAIDAIRPLFVKAPA